MAKRKNYSFKIYTNQARRKGKDGKIPLYLKITFDGQKAEMRLPPTIDLTENDLPYWDETIMRLKGKNSPINHYLNKLEGTYGDYMLQQNYAPLDSLPEILKIISGEKVNKQKIKVIDFMSQFLQNQIEPDNSRTPGTIRNYRKPIAHFQKFMTQSSFKNLALGDFKYEHAKQFQLYFGSPEVNNHAVSASSNIRRIKTAFNEAIKEELIQRNPFDNIKLTYKAKTRTPYLTIEQLQRIASCEKIKNDGNLRFYWDLFIFSCFTGLSCIDYRNLSEEFLHPVYGKRIKLDTQRTKSGKRVVQILVKPAQMILEKYRGPLNSDGKIFPSVTMETINEKLKIIGAMAGINFPLSTKISRTTCNQLLINVGEMDAIYKRTYLGWSNTSDIQNVYTTIEDSILLRNTERIETYLYEHGLAANY